MTTPTTDQLREAITEIDCMAQSAFSEIATLARLVLHSLETKEPYNNPESLADVLTVIWGKALDAENYINCMAEGVGCNYKNEALHRRYEAQRKAGAATTSGRA